MAGGFAKDGAVQDQIDATIEDAVNRVRSRIGRGDSRKECTECGKTIPQARRAAMPGVQLCVSCLNLRHAADRNGRDNRRGSKEAASYASAAFAALQYTDFATWHSVCHGPEWPKR